MVIISIIVLNIILLLLIIMIFCSLSLASFIIPSPSCLLLLRLVPGMQHFSTFSPHFPARSRQKYARTCINMQLLRTFSTCNSCPSSARPSPHALSQPCRLDLPTWLLSAQSPRSCTHSMDGKFKKTSPVLEDETNPQHVEPWWINFELSHYLNVSEKRWIPSAAYKVIYRDHLDWIPEV